MKEKIRLGIIISMFVVVLVTLFFSLLEWFMDSPYMSKESLFYYSGDEITIERKVAEVQRKAFEEGRKLTIEEVRMIERWIYGHTQPILIIEMKEEGL